MRLGSASSAPGQAPRSARRYASLVPCAEVALGHIALSAQQCAVYGLAPFSHARVQRLGGMQRALVREAAERTQHGQDAGTAGSAPGADPPSLSTPQPNSASPQQAQQAEGAAGEASAGQVVPSGQGPAVDAAAEVDLEGLSWLKDPLDKAVRVVLPILGDKPRALLQVGGEGRVGRKGRRRPPACKLCELCVRTSCGGSACMGLWQAPCPAHGFP